MMKLKTKASSGALFLVLLLAGCMGTATHQEPTLHPTRLHVVRPGLVGFHQQQVAPFDRTVRDAAAVQRLYTATLALPHPSHPPWPCANDFGLVYHLTFLEGTSHMQQMDVQPLNCNHLVDLTLTDIRQYDQSFLTLLASTIGFPSLIPPGLLPPS